MRVLILFILFAMMEFVTAGQPGHAVGKYDYPLVPMPFNKVKLEDEFWLPRLKTQAKVTVPFALDKTKPAVENLRRCANFLHDRGGQKPSVHRFLSSDLYKVMEGAAYLLMIDRDQNIEKRMDEIIDIIGDAQKDDGYLYVSHICGIPNHSEMGKTPYSWVVHSHELYTMGHMYEGAIAYYRATGKDKWLKIAEKSAQHLQKVFFEGDPNYNGGKPIRQAPGHQEIELALCKLYRTTENRLYLDLAKNFLDVRGVTYVPKGEGVMSPEYAQQHKPVVEQEKAVGHAVRAAYMYAGMADVSALTGDISYAKALDKIWHNIVDAKMHITGGLGAVHGIEGFGPDYVLPNKNAYNETCAAISNVFFNFRMFLLHKDAKYMDVAEVSLLNNSLAGVNMEGNKFFYVNPLEADGKKHFNHGKKGRSPWFDCACCPSNIARLMPQVSGYMYAHTDNEIYVTLYSSNSTEIQLKGCKVGVKQISYYPFDGKVLLTIIPEKKKKFTLKLRIPTWAQEKFVPGELYSYVRNIPANWTIKVNGRPVKATLNKGFASVERRWKVGDKVELNIPMPVRFNTCIDKVKANLGRVAVTCGPLVYCAEEVDNDRPVQRFFIKDVPEISSVKQEPIEEGVLNGVVRIEFSAGINIDEDIQESNVKLVPYYAWNNRGEKSMIVWFPRNADMVHVSDGSVKEGKYASVKTSHTFYDDTETAISDGKQPKSSFDTSIPRWTSWPEKGKKQWVEILISEPKEIRSIGVYWYDDNDGVQTPGNWSLQYRKDGKWKPFEKYVTDSYSTFKNKYNVVHPAAKLVSDAIRINMNPKPNACVGILDVDIEYETAEKH